MSRFNKFFIDRVAGNDRLDILEWCKRYRSRLVEYWNMTPEEAAEWLDEGTGCDPESSTMYWRFAKDPEGAADDDKTYGD